MTSIGPLCAPVADGAASAVPRPSVPTNMIEVAKIPIVCFILSFLGSVLQIAFMVLSFWLWFAKNSLSPSTRSRNP